MTWLVPAAAAVVGAFFAATVAARARRTGAPHDVLWTAGLVAYALASALEARADLDGWSLLRYRLYFALAPALVGLLGAGTVHLVAGDERRRWAEAFSIFVFALLAGAGLGQLGVPLNRFVLLGHDAELGARAVPFPHPARVSFLLVNVVGGLALVGGAAWSGWRESDRAVLAIGAGALLPFLGGVLSSAGWTGLRVPLQLAGVVVMYAGYQGTVGSWAEPDDGESDAAS